MTPIKRRLLYIFRGSLLRLRISWTGGNSLTLSTGYHIDRTDAKGKPKWDGCRCLRNTAHGPDKMPAHTVNRVLEQLEEDIDRAFYEFESSDRIPAPDQLKEAIKRDKDRGRQSVWNDFVQFLRDGEQTRQWSFNTIKTLRSLMSLLKAFDPDLSYSSIDGSWTEKFIAYQQTHKLKKGARKKTCPTVRIMSEGYSNTVIEKNCRMLKWFLKWAARKGRLETSVVEGMRIDLKTIERPVIYLEWEELMRLYRHELAKGSREDRIRDVFCFCCFSSLRYSDAYSLRKSQVGKETITVVTQKTSDSLIIELNRYTRSILSKYADTEGEYALPRIGLRDFNYHLKNLAEAVGLDRPVHMAQYYGPNRMEKTEPLHRMLSSHCARRTFVVNALSMGISPVVVMRWTGHSDYSAMRPYIAIADSSRKESMSRFDTHDQPGTAGSPAGMDRSHNGN